MVRGSRIGDYVIDGELPATSSEVAYAATHVVLPRRARVQALHPSVAGLQGGARQLMREACILEALRHGGVPRVYECGLLPDRQPWVAIELIEGPTLADEIGGHPLPVPDVIGLLRDLAEILHHAHLRGVVHCHVRPEAIVRRVPVGADKSSLFLTEWAAACTHDSVPAQLFATRPYVAPELERGESFDGRADVFALGVVAYQALTGAAPAMPTASRAPGAPRGLATLIDRMISLEQLARPTAAEVRAEAMRLAGYVEAPIDAVSIESVSLEEAEIDLVDLVDLVDISRQPVAAPPREAKLRWTPADPYQRPSPLPDSLSPRRKRP